MVRLSPIFLAQIFTLILYMYIDVTIDRSKYVLAMTGTAAFAEECQRSELGVFRK